MLSDVSKQIQKLAVLVFISLLLSACGGAGEDESANTSSTASSSTTNTAKPDGTSSSSTSSSLAPDTTPPSTTSLQVYRISSTSITLKWQPSADNVEVSFYEIRRNDSIIATLSYPDSSIQDNGLNPNTTHSYTITSIDSSGNRSVRSSPLITKTLPSLGSISNTSSSSSASSIDASNSSNGGISVNSSSSSSSVDNQKTFSWSHPKFRENGNFLELDEIGGYELRFKQNPNEDFVYLTIEGNETTSLSTDFIPNNSIVEISTYDTNGLHSNFVAIQPQ